MVNFFNDPLFLNREYFDNKCIEKAVKELKHICSNEEDRTILDAIEDGIRDYNNNMKSALEKGLKEGKKINQ